MERLQETATPVNKRDAILAAALELFAERGFHGTAVPLIAERAQVGAGTVYRYFESKEALVNALFQRWKGELLRRLTDGFPVGKPAREQFSFFWRRMGEFVGENPRAFAFCELHHHRAYLDETSKALEEQILGWARAFLQDAQSRGEIRDEAPEILMATVYGAFVGVVKASWLGYLELTPELLAAAEATVWDSVRRPPGD